jgi:hypothetical protein
VSARGAEQRLARLEAVSARAVELLDEGRVDEARELLVGALAADGLAPGISERELERALEDARPETDRMLDADSVAQTAMRQADHLLESEDEIEEVGEEFQTATMAELLERQGDPHGASRIRASLAEPKPPAPRAPAAGAPSIQEMIGTLERWLENLRGGARP